MVTQCFVPNCRTRAIKNSGISFHRLPLDSGQKEKWLKAIRRQENTKNINLRNVSVCSKHFTSSDFRYAGSSVRIRKNAIPTIFPWCEAVNSRTGFKRTGARLMVDRSFETRVSVGDSNGLPNDHLGDVADNDKMYRATMPGMRCAVGVCTNKSGNKVSFYRFPKNKQIRKVWIQRCRRADKWNPDHGRVCSEHFKEDDYQRNLQAEFLNMPTKKKLKDTAIPSLKLSNNNYVETTSPGKLERRRRYAKRASKSLLYDILTKRNKNNEDNAVVKTENEEMGEEKSEISVVTTENAVWLSSISQSESSHMIEENNYESSEVVNENVDIVKTENEDWLPSISQSVSPEMSEENCESSVTTENVALLPSESSHNMIEEIKHESIEIVDEDVIVKTENEVCLPSISQFASPDMIEEECESNAVTTENVVWLPFVSQSESLTIIENYENLQKKYDAVVKENVEIKRQMRLAYGVMKEDKKQLKSLEKDLASLTTKLSSETAYRIQTENSLKSFFSPAQRDIVLRQRKQVLWSAEDISHALAIRNMSKKCYIYLQKQLKYPLPELSCLQRWAAKLNVQQTILTDETCKES